MEGEKKKTMEMWERAMEKLNVTKKRHGETEKSEVKRRNTIKTIRGRSNRVMR